MAKRVMTDEKIAQAQEMHDRGLSCVAIGKELGVSHSAVHANLSPEAQEHSRNYYTDYYASHKEPIGESRRKYLANNPETRAATTASYRAANSEEIKEAGAVYRSSNKEKEAARHVRYQRDNRDKLAAWAAARRALIAGVTIGNLAEIAEIYRKAKEDPNIRCYLCGNKVPLGERHVDHIEALTNGGSHRPSNLGVSCADCNLKKGAKTLEEMGLLL